MFNWEKSLNLDGKLCLHTVLKKKSPSPNLQGLKIIQGIESNHISSYPRKCKTDEQKFIHLSNMFIKDMIDKPMYMEFADVLTFLHPQWKDKKEEKIEEVLTKKLVSEIKWGD